MLLYAYALMCVCVIARVRTENHKFDVGNYIAIGRKCLAPCPGKYSLFMYLSNLSSLYGHLLRQTSNMHLGMLSTQCATSSCIFRRMCFWGASCQLRGCKKKNPQEYMRNFGGLTVGAWLPAVLRRLSSSASLKRLIRTSARQCSQDSP